MKSFSMLFAALVVILVGAGMEAGADGEWKSFQVTFKMDPEFRSGPAINWKGRSKKTFDEGTGTIQIPANLKQGETIRGVLPSTRGLLKEFAFRNRLAMYSGDAATPYGGPQGTFLRAAAKASGHPEIAHAGAVLWGTSNRGRYAAHFAHFWPGRTIAVILDHAFCNGPMAKTASYDYPNLPVAEGVPYFFNASQKDMYQNFDRRALHYRWCTAGFKRGHPCTSVISHEAVGHSNPGDRSLQILWLEEVMALRVPADINPDGTPYQLRPVDPRKMGGHVHATLTTFEGRSIHTHIDIGPVGSVKNESWWVPGPRSAAMYLEWVAKNDGSVKRDQGSSIRNYPFFNSLPAALNGTYGMIKQGQYGKAYTVLGKAKARYPLHAGILSEIVSGEVDIALKGFERTKSGGDVYGLWLSLKEGVRKYRPVPEFEEELKKYSAFFNTPETKRELNRGKEFYRIIDNAAKAKSPNSRSFAVRSIKQFAERNAESPYGKAAARAHEELSQKPNLKLRPQECFNL